MANDAYTHMKEAWGCDDNPFPQDGIRSEGSNQPVSDRVFETESREMAHKFIRGGLSGSLRMGFLWSQGPRGIDTGFGKTTLQQRMVSHINEDFGERILKDVGVSAPPKIAAVYTSLQNLNGIGLFPVLFQAAAKLAAPEPNGGRPVLDRARDLIAEKIGDSDPNAIKREIMRTRLTIAPTGSPLREELMQAFLTGDLGLGAEIIMVKDASRVRNGVHYLDFAVTVLAAAGIARLFVMIDQLEDLVGNRSVSAAKRSREVARIRDLLEVAPFGQHVSFTFTFHHSAASVLKDFWVQNRLPPFEVNDANQAAIVVLRGLQDSEQVTEILRVYLDDVRDTARQDILPFQPNVAPVLLDTSGGRVGILLQQAHELFNAAAQINLPSIDGDFARRFLAGQVSDRMRETGDSEPALPGGDVADMLLR
jgi:hypothetical protein